jgi:hypothetical protein
MIDTHKNSNKYYTWDIVKAINTGARASALQDNTTVTV